MLSGRSWSGWAFFCHGSSRWDRPCKAGGDHGVTSLIWLPIHLRIRCHRCSEVSFQPHSSFSNTTSAAMAGAILKAPETVSRQCASMTLISMLRFALENTEGAELPVSFKRVRHQALVRHRVHCVVRFDQKGLIALALQRR